MRRCFVVCTVAIGWRWVSSMGPTESWIGSHCGGEPRREGSTEVLKKVWAKSTLSPDRHRQLVACWIRTAELKDSRRVITHRNDRSAVLLAVQARGQRKAGGLEYNNWLEKRGVLLEGKPGKSGVGSDLSFFLQYSNVTYALDFWVEKYPIESRTERITEWDNSPSTSIQIHRAWGKLEISLTFTARLPCCFRSFVPMAKNRKKWTFKTNSASLWLLDQQNLTHIRAIHFNQFSLTPRCFLCLHSDITGHNKLCAKPEGDLHSVS